MPMDSRVRRLLFAFICGFLLIGLLAYRLIEEGYAGSELIFGLGSFSCYLLWYLWLGADGSTARLIDEFAKNPKKIWFIPALSSLVYGVYLLGTGNWATLSFRPILFYFAPYFLIFLFPTREQKLTWQDIVIILLIWIPIDARWIQPMWPWPPGIGGNAFTITASVPLLAALMIAIRGLNGVKFHWGVDRQDWKPMTINFLIFLAFAVPVGIYTGFIKWSGFKLEWGIAFTFIITFLWVAVPEELLFRGFIQNLFHKTWPSHPQVTMWVASLIFGLSHLNNGDHPDWRYAVLATVAGYLYGRTFNQCRSFVPAVIVHALVDTVWVHFFRG